MSTRLFDIEKQLKRFLSSAAQSELLKESSGLSGVTIIEAHVQKRWLDSGTPSVAVLSDGPGNGKINCLNIVNVSVAEKNRRKGLFKDFLELLEGFDYRIFFDECTCFYIRIDKVMNPVLDEFLPRRGYTRTKQDKETHFSYHKVVREMFAVSSEFTDQPVTDYVFT